MAIQIKEVQSHPELTQIKELFLQYGIERTFDKALKGYQQEIDNLPGNYAPPTGQLLIAKVDQAAAGCIAYQKLSANICEMKRLYVLPKYRELGLGKLLIQQILVFAMESGYDTMKLDSHPTMLQAQKLYKKFGFKPTTRYNENPIEGILFYEKKLK